MHKVLHIMLVVYSGNIIFKIYSNEHQAIPDPVFHYGYCGEGWRAWENHLHEEKKRGGGGG